MGRHIEELDKKITEASNEIKRLDGEIATTQTELGKLLVGDGNEDKADAIQKKREELVRAKERAEIRVQALTAEKPAAARLDAQDRLNELAGEAAKLATANDTARAAFLAALDVLIETIQPAFSPA